jgi:DNA-binding NtrC family response regulator
MSSFATLCGLKDDGRFKEALAQFALLSADARRSAEGIALESELLVETGDLYGGQALARRVSSQEHVDPLTRAAALKVLGQAAFYRGDADHSLKYLLEAKGLLDGSHLQDTKVYAAVLLVKWRLFSRVNSNIAAADFDRVRRAVLRSGSMHQLAELRVAVAEGEARNGSPHEALRHLAHAARLVANTPNAWLAGMTHNHTSNVFRMLGDLENATVFADRAIACTDVSGHFRIRTAARINLVEIELARGNLATAERLIEQLLPAVGEHLYLRAAALDAASKIHIARRRFDLARQCMGHVVRLRRQKRNSMPTDWERASELFSRATLFEADGRTGRAIHLLRRGIHRAIEANARFWETKMRLKLATLESATSSSAAADAIVHVLAGNPEGAETMADISLARAHAELAIGNTSAALSHGTRSRRISEVLGLSAGDAVQKLSSSAVPTSASVSLDDAVALMELAGYPHVLAREAYALLDVSGAAEALALVARGEQGVRCVATRDWSEAEAAAAAQDPGDHLRIICGTHRDESWQVLARLRPGLDDRCTGVAIRKLVDTAVSLDQYRRDEKQRAALWPADTLETDGGLWVSEQMTELLSIARRIAPSDVTVLLTGETGTGKEVLARVIHRASPRGGKPFIPFNCTAVPREMLESQLFGYRKGAFTGANEAFDGVIRAAAGGTLFLDEIAEIGPELQPKLLRFLETREVHGLGESQPVKVDVRIVAATNADLDGLVADGRFREDLFYRLNVVRLRLPPLRERREEIPPLVDYYLRTTAEAQKKGRLTLDDETLEYLVLYAWPGNVRQLVNEVSRIVAYADPDSVITPALLSPEIQASRKTVRVRPGEEPEIRVRLDQPLNDAVDAIERMMVVRALDRARGNYENAARLLGISRKGLFLKRRRWGMKRAS